MATLDLLLLLALSGIWGSSFIFMRALAPVIGPVATADARMFIAGAALAAFYLLTGFRPGWRKNAKHFLITGLLNSAIPFLLYSIAALFLPASMEAVFNSLSPMFGALFAALWLQEPLTLRKTAGLALGVCGVVLMSSLGGLGNGITTYLSIGACLLAPLCYGLAGVYIKKRAADVKPMAIAGGSQLFGGLAMMPFLLLAPPGRASLDLRVVLLTVVFALLCSAVAYLIYYRLIANVGPTRALTVTFLIPVFAMLWGVLFLGEVLTASTIAGAAVILAGTSLVTLKGSRKERRP
jgi:drug/metabolite transporter (DMT)-like permease